MLQNDEAEQEAAYDARNHDFITVPTSGNTLSDPEQAKEQQQGSVVVVEQLKGEKGNPLGHVAIGIDGATPVGLVPDSDKAAAKALAKEALDAEKGTPPGLHPVPGHVEPLAKGRKEVGRAVIHVTREQADAMRAAIRDMTQHPQVYDPAYRNCTNFVEQVLRAGGVNAPNDATPGGLVSDLNKQSPH